MTIMMSRKALEEYGLVNLGTIHWNLSPSVLVDAAAGADPRYRLPIQVITELAWHNLFAQQLFLRAQESDLTSERPGFTILCVPQFRTNPRTHGTRSDAAIIIDFQERLVLIAGTQYAGEMKKSIFTVLNFILPA